jgi:uncharacterized protein (DUF1697 family)
MQKHIAVLRGINVGGRRIIKMNELKLMFEDMEFVQVETYIQSGNVAFSTKKYYDRQKFENKIEARIFKTFGFDVPVITRTFREIKEIIESNPFIEGDDYDIDRLYLSFLNKKPSNEKLTMINGINTEPDKFRIIDDNIYSYCSGKYHESKFTNQFFEKKLDLKATTRNWKTVLKLLELMEK